MECEGGGGYLIQIWPCPMTAGVMVLSNFGRMDNKERVEARGCDQHDCDQHSEVDTKVDAMQIIVSSCGWEEASIIINHWLLRETTRAGSSRPTTNSMSATATLTSNDNNRKLSEAGCVQLQIDHHRAGFSRPTGASGAIHRWCNTWHNQAILNPFNLQQG